MIYYFQVPKEPEIELCFTQYFTLHKTMIISYIHGEFLTEVLRVDPYKEKRETNIFSILLSHRGVPTN